MTIPDIAAADFAREVLDHPQPVLVDFYGHHCSGCRSLLPILEEVAAERTGTVKLVKINAHDHAQLAARYRVSTVPNLVLFRRGEVIGQRIGRTPKRDLLAWLDGG